MCFIPPTEPKETIDYLDIAFKIATISIAIFNSFLTIKIFTSKDKKDTAEKERDRKIQLLKTLVLDHNFKEFHSIFDEIEEELLELKQTNLTDLTKSAIDEKIGDLFIKLRRKFYDPLLAIDTGLHKQITEKCDGLQSHFSQSIFDQGIVLSHQPKYDEIINEKVIKTKADIIKILFSYRGDN